MRHYKLLIFFIFAIINQANASEFGSKYASNSTGYRPSHAGYPGFIDETAGLDKSVLIIIDMQPYFYKRELASTPESAQNMVKDEIDNLNQKIATYIKKAKKNGQTIIFVESETSRAESHDLITNEVLTNQVKGYAHAFFTARKRTDDGSREIIELLKKQKLDTNDLHICGQYADACVHETISGLTKALPNRSILVLADACRSSAYVEDNRGTIYASLPSGYLKSRLEDFRYWLNHPMVTLSHAPKRLFSPLKEYLGLSQTILADGMIGRYFALLKEAKIKPSANFSENLLLLARSNPSIRLKTVQFLSDLNRITYVMNPVIIELLNDSDREVGKIAYDSINYSYRLFPKLDDIGITKIIGLIENSYRPEQIKRLLEIYNFSLPQEGVEKLLRFTTNANQQIKQTASEVLLEYIKQLRSMPENQYKKLLELGAFNYYESTILSDSFDPEKAKKLIRDLMNLSGINDEEEYFQIIPSAYGVVIFKIGRR